MNELAIIGVNDVLGIVDTYLLTGREIDQLTASGHDPLTLCEYYATALTTCEWRGKTDPTMPNVIDAIVAFGAVDGCVLVAPSPVAVVDVDVPYLGGSIP